MLVGAACLTWLARALSHGVMMLTPVPTRCMVSSTSSAPPTPTLTRARQKLSKKQVKKLCKTAKKSKKKCKKGDAKNNCKFSKKKGCVPK